MMTSVPVALADRLDALWDQGVIAGWKDAGGPNYGLQVAPLPAMIFPANEGSASMYYTAAELTLAIQALEMFGPMALFAAHRRVG